MKLLITEVLLMKLHPLSYIAIFSSAFSLLSLTAENMYLTILHVFKNLTVSHFLNRTSWSSG
jgi:hypothetical protein